MEELFRSESKIEPKKAIPFSVQQLVELRSELDGHGDVPSFQFRQEISTLPAEFEERP